MKLTTEPKEVDFVIKSEPWSEKDLADFRVLIQEAKTKNKRRTTIAAAKKTQPPTADKPL